MRIHKARPHVHEPEHMIVGMQDRRWVAACGETFSMFAVRRCTCPDQRCDACDFMLVPTFLPAEPRS